MAVAGSFNSVLGSGVPAALLTFVSARVGAVARVRADARALVRRYRVEHVPALRVDATGASQAVLAGAGLPGAQMLPDHVGESVLESRQVVERRRPHV